MARLVSDYERVLRCPVESSVDSALCFPRLSLTTEEEKEGDADSVTSESTGAVFSDQLTKDQALAAAIEEKCAFCESKQGQLKVLWCLHVACKACLTEFIREDNAVSCSRCQFITQDLRPGRKLVDCLADWPTPESGACLTSIAPTLKSPISVCQDEDCEDSAELASAECLTCGILLCEAHFAIHTRSKRSRDHNVRQLTGTSAAQRCQLHSTELLELYCHTCQVLLCKVCLRRSDVHKKHPGRCVDIDVAVENIKRAYRERHRLCLGHQGLSVTVHDDQLLEADGQIESINAQNVSLSEQLSADFSAYQDILVEREVRLKDELDKKSWKALQTLDSRKVALTENRRLHLITQYLQTQLSSIDVLRVLGAKTKPAAALDKCPVTSTGADGLVYVPIPPVQRDQAASLGRIHRRTDVLSPQDSPAQHSKSVCATSGASTLGQQPSRVDLHPTMPATPSRTGERVRFSTSQKSLMVNLSEDSKTATARMSKKTKYRSVCGAVEFRDVLSFGVKVDLCEKGLFLGVADPGVAANHDNAWSHGSSFCGWPSHQNLFKSAEGKCLGQPWQDGDFIVFTVDCSKLRMTALHVRSMKVQTLNLPEHPLCFRAELADGSSITLVDIPLSSQ